MSAVFTVLKAYSKCDLGVVRGVESNNGGVELGHRDDLRSTRLGADILLAYSLIVIYIVPAAVQQEIRILAYSLHALLHLIEHGFHSFREILHDLRLRFADKLGEIVIVHCLDNVRTVSHAVIRDGHCLGRQVQRRQKRFRLTDSCLYRITGIPLYPEFLKKLRRGHAPGGHRYLESEVLPYAELLRPVVQPVDSEPARGFVEEYIAGMLQTELHRDRPVNPRTARSVARRVILVSSSAGYRGGGVYHAVRKSGGGGDGLKRGAGTVFTVYRTVQQRRILGVEHRAVILHEVVQVVSRNGRHRKHRAILDVQHYRGAYLGVLSAEVRVHRCGVVRRMQKVHVVLQDIHHHVLEIRINGEHDGIACLRLLDYLVGNLHAVGIPGDLPGAALAAERAFQRGFYSGGADDVVHGVACALQLSVLFRRYRTDCPSQVWRGGSVKVDTVPALGYLHARHERGKLLQLQHRVTGQPGSNLVFILIVEIHQIHLVAHSGDVPPHGLLVLVGNVVVFV